MGTLVTIKGIVTNQIIWQPKEGKKGTPYLKIDLLQINDTGTNVVTIKDEDLNSTYENGQELSIDCIASPWNMNNMSGVSFKVFRGETRKLDLKPHSTKKPA